MLRKTKVYKAIYDGWAVAYYCPFRGDLYVWFSSWQAAMDEACRVEKNRAWV